MRRLLIVALVVMLVLAVASSALAKGPTKPSGSHAGKPVGSGAGKPPGVGAGQPRGHSVGKLAGSGTGKPAGSGAGKAWLYNSEAFTCTMGAADVTGPAYGFVILNSNSAGDLIVQVSLKRATPGTDYDIWVNQDPGACPLEAATAIAALHTNGMGNGNAHLVVDKLEAATKFWVSVVGGGLTLRSPAIGLD